MKPSILMLPLVLLALPTGNAQTNNETRTEPKNSAIVKALQEAFDRSVAHDKDLSARALELAQKMQAMAERLPKGTKMDQLTESERDEWNLMSAQQAYLKKSMYLEVLKRRELAQLQNLIKAYEIQDRAYEGTVLRGRQSSASGAQTEADGEIRKEFGEGVGDYWIKALTEINSAQKLMDAQSVPLKNLVARIEFAKEEFGIWSDDLEFVFEAGFPNTPAGQLFLRRLAAGIKAGNKDAVTVGTYIKTNYLITDEAK